MIHLRVPYGTDPQGFFWPESDQKRGELRSVKRGSPADFEATYQCRPGSRQGSIFLDSDFVYYKAPVDLDLGLAGQATKAFCSHGHGIFQAWDTAFSQTVESAHSACITGMFLPCNQYHRGEPEETFGPCERHFDVLILDVFREKLDWGGLVSAFKTQNAKWHPELIIIEKRASGISLFQSMQAGGLPIKGVNVADGKVARAIHGTVAGSVQGWFRQHRVQFPHEAPWLKVYTTELKDFSGSDDSPSDQVDGTVHLITHAIDTGSGASMLPSDWQPERADGGVAEMIWHKEQKEAAQQAAGPAPGDPRAEMMLMIGQLPEMSFDPFAGTCDRCSNHDRGWCRLQERRVVAFDSCSAFSSPEVEGAAGDMGFGAAMLGAG